MNINESNLEVCAFKDAIYLKINNHIYQTPEWNHYSGKVHIRKSLDCWVTVEVEDFDFFNIVPMRKKIIVPLEFECTTEFFVTHTVESHGHESDRGIYVLEPNDKTIVLKDNIKFKCTQIIEAQ